jgi:hypothetical protein
MSLSLQSLRRNLVRFFSEPANTPSAPAAEERLARIYHEYAREAEDVSGENPVSTTQAAFQGPLDFRRSTTVRRYAEQVEAAFVAYWTGAAFAVGVVPPPVPPCPNVGGNGIFATETSSVVSAVAPRVLYAKLMPVLTSLQAPAQVQADRFARAFDEATKSAVTVLITGTDTTPGPTGPLPITNTCTVT